MHKRNSNTRSHTDQTHWDSRVSYYSQNLNLNNQPPQFDPQEMFRSPEVFLLAQQILQAQREGLIPGYAPDRRMSWVSSQHLSSVGLQDSSRRYSCSAQNLVSNIRANQFGSQGKLNNPKQYRAPQNTTTHRQIGNVKNGLPPGCVHDKYLSAQQLDLVGRRERVSQHLSSVELQDSSRRYSCSTQNLVSNIRANQFGSQGKLNNLKQYRAPQACIRLALAKSLFQNTTTHHQSGNVRGGLSPGSVHGKFRSAQHLDLVGRRETVSASPMKKARLHLKFSNLPQDFAVKDVIQHILGTDKMLVIWHGRPDIHLLRDENGGPPYCVAQFINEMEAEKIRVFWNGTEIVKGKGKLIVEYLDY